MKQKIARLLSKALKSGDYPQTKERLRDPLGFCCLGVLCNLHAQAHPRIAKRERNPYVYMGEAKVLPIEVMRWAGMTSCEGGYGADTLTGINDDGVSFKKIASIIDKHWRDL